MTAASTAAAQPVAHTMGKLKAQRLLRALLPALSLALVLMAIATLNPRAISYFGFTLMLNLAIPIALAKSRRCSSSSATTRFVDRPLRRLLVVSRRPGCAILRSSES
jgi:hypothetical protein